MPKVNIFWFRRDLRLEDNAGLYHALKDNLPVVPVFIFDRLILDEIDDRADHRVGFIHQTLTRIQHQLQKMRSTLYSLYGSPLEIFDQLSKEYEIDTVYTNHDYEPYATERDEQVKKFLHQKGISFRTFKDQVMFEKNETVKDDGQPYSVFTPYSKKWLSRLTEKDVTPYNTTSILKNFFKQPVRIIPSLQEMDFATVAGTTGSVLVDDDLITNYHETRNLPAIHGTSRLGIHLRFGTISVRELVARALTLNSTFLKELIWREFFMQLLWQQPQLVTRSCKKEYDNIRWRNHEDEFEKWCSGKTGYPIVDAGMRELNETGFMHNRVRMITASFLVKHLLIDWRWGEIYFAKKLMDYELASNNGNWQWVAGCGCDAAPYFRIFNPALQTKKFDPDLTYIRKWVPELDSFSYPLPIVDHDMARQRCLQVYKAALVRL